jgi:hypothetical protein
MKLARVGQSARRAAAANMAFGALLALTALGCSDDSELVIVIEHPTLIEVNPEEFLGRVPCLAAEGAMRRYVATVFDVSPLDDETGAAGAGGADDGPVEDFALPSSGPTPCTAPIATAFVVPGRHYAAQVDAFDRQDIEPLAAGSRVMLDSESKEIVTPRWTTSCGRERGESVMAVYQATRRVSNCAPLVDSAPSQAEPKVSVSLDQARGDLACGTDPGQIARFEVRDPASAQSAEAICNEAATLVGLPAMTALELEVSAFEAGKMTPSFGALCSATPLSGITVEAVCEPLASKGALDIDLPKALSTVSLECDQTREVVADPAGDALPKRVTPPGCNTTLRLSDLPPGETTVSLSTTLSDGSAGPTLTCTGTVLPGLTAPAECVSN